MLYVLHGATSVPKEWLDGQSYQGMDLKSVLDSLIAARVIPETLVVMPNFDNALGSHWYANSPALGNWEDFIVSDVIRHVDNHLRTEARRTRRALYGHSIGGFGALAIGFWHPAVFGLIYSSSPSLVALTAELGPTSTVWRRPLVRAGLKRASQYDTVVCLLARLLLSIFANSPINTGAVPSEVTLEVGHFVWAS